VDSLAVARAVQAVPIAFEIMARKENWRTPLQGIQWTIARYPVCSWRPRVLLFAARVTPALPPVPRSIILRIGSLYAFFFTYFIERAERMASPRSLQWMPLARGF
jgi:hypothetical protein